MRLRNLVENGLGPSLEGSLLRGPHQAARRTGQAASFKFPNRLQYIGRNGRIARIGRYIFTIVYMAMIIWKRHNSRVPGPERETAIVGTRGLGMLVSTTF